LKHLGDIDLGKSEKVSINVLEGKRSAMPEARFRKIIESKTFPPDCVQRASDDRNYIVYEVVTGKLSFTFWRKIGGKWEVGNIQVKDTDDQKTSSVNLGPGEPKVSLRAVWTTTKEGAIQMTEVRVLAVHARKWKPSSGEFGPRMSFFQFHQIKDLPWHLLAPGPD
jgi:hypothetical protein